MKTLTAIFIIAILLIDFSYPQFWKRKGTKEIPKNAYSTAIKQYNRGNYEEALELLLQSESLVETNKVTEYQFLLMKTYKGTGQFSQAREIGRLFLRNYPLSRYTPEVFLTFGDMFIDEGNKTSAFRMYIDARRIESNPQSKKRIDERIKKAIQLSLPHSVLDELLSLEFDQNIRSIIILAKAYTFLNDGDPDNCSSTLSGLDPSQIDKQFKKAYEKLYLASYNPPVRTFKVGVVMPLSGADRAKGEAFIAGLVEAGQFIKGPNTNISYLVRDNQGDDVETIRQINYLKRNNEVDLIIGPLSNENILAAAATMEGIDLPMLVPASNSSKITTISENIYLVSPSFAEQGRIAARYSSQLGLIPEIAIIAPADEFGQETVDAFLKELDRLELHPAAVEWYYDLPENISRQFKSVRDAAWELVPIEKDDKYLGLEIDSLDALFDVSADDFFDLPVEEKKKMSRSDSLKTILETIDIVFMPVHDDHLKYIATQFPMHNLKARVLGNSGWLNKDILSEENVRPHYSGLTILTDRFYDPILDSLLYLADPELKENVDIYSTGIDLALFITEVMGNDLNTGVSFQDKLKNTDTFRGLSRYFDFKSNDLRINNGMQVIEFNNSNLSPKGFFAQDSFQLKFPDTP